MRYAPRLVAVAVLVFVAGALYQSRRHTWGGADLPDGTRYKISPVGISHVLRPSQTISPTRDCRWESADDPESLCRLESGSRAALHGLLFVPVLLVTATWLCLATAVTVSWLPWGPHRLTRLLPAVAMVLAVAAPALFAWTAPSAVTALRGLPFGTGGTLGTLQVAFGAATLSGFAIAAWWLDARGAKARWGSVAALGFPPAAAFYAMFPLVGGQAFLIGALVLGFGSGYWLHRTAPWPRMNG